MTRMLGVIVLLASLTGHAIVPVEGILLGEAQESLQNDPLKLIFSDIYDKSLLGENKKVKLYFANFDSAEKLKDGCHSLSAPVYASVVDEKQAKRVVAATLQFIGLDITMKAIGAYARKLEIPEHQYSKLTSNLVRNYCSKNISVMSVKTIEKALGFYYRSPDMLKIPSIVTSPFAPDSLKDATEKTSARSKEFDLVIKNFRSFCSWGGESEDYRLLTSYLKNPVIMSFVIRNLRSLQKVIDSKELKVVSKVSTDTVQILCEGLVCRRTSITAFDQSFPKTVGSTGILPDLVKLYCHHFKFQDSINTTVPQIKEWIKKSELEDSVFETSHFIALMTGVPDFFNAGGSYREVADFAKSSVDDRWNKWAKKMLNNFSHDLLFEESLKVKILTRKNAAEISRRGFGFDFSITLGELDRLIQGNDKLSASFDLKISKNYLRMLRTKWITLTDEVDTEGKKKFKEEVANYIGIQLKQKEKLFLQKIWNEDFSRLMADEMIQQAISYKGSMFLSYSDEVLKLPVNISYGLFALSYLRYRSDVNAGRLKLNL
jgi:hypothetical protein